jgi:hypothetical protein
MPSLLRIPQLPDGVISKAKADSIEEVRLHGLRRGIDASIASRKLGLGQLVPGCTGCHLNSGDPRLDGHDELLVGLLLVRQESSVGLDGAALEEAVTLISGQVSIAIANGLGSADTTIVHGRKGSMALAPGEPDGMVTLGSDGLLQHGPKIAILDKAPVFLPREGASSDHLRASNEGRILGLDVASTSEA